MLKKYIEELDEVIEYFDPDVWEELKIEKREIERERTKN